MAGARYEKLDSPRESLDEDSLEVPHPRGHSFIGHSCKLYLGPWWIWLLHASLLFCYTAAALLVLKTRSGTQGEFKHLEYGPLRDVIKYDREYFDLEFGKPSPYAGTGPAVDDAWDAISALPGEVGTIKIQRNELLAMNLSSVLLADGSGYAVTIDVFHQIHCLNFLRKSIINNTADSPLWQDHVDHCLDSLRLSTQCHSDTSLLTYKWVKGYSKPWPDFRSFHTCRNFEAIRQFAVDHWFNARQPGLVIHPERGPVDWDKSHPEKRPYWPYQYIEVD
ncbi:hypothetical protein F5Y04DRAFT_276772 [Hypomontagnella monticulosa]|nr:hypothetical protein F5Y04DRAFT_276772 [Hypomontagnella monticulosa]